MSGEVEFPEIPNRTITEAEYLRGMGAIERILKTHTLTPQPIFFSGGDMLEINEALGVLAKMSHPDELLFPKDCPSSKTEGEPRDTISRKKFSNIVSQCAEQLTREESGHWNGFNDPEKKEDMMRHLADTIRTILTSWGYAIETPEPLIR